MSKTRTCKKPARAPRATTWSNALLEPILNTVVGPRIRAILSAGVTSREDLRAKFQKAYSCSVAADVFKRWLVHLGLDSLFTSPRTISLSPQEAERLPSANKVPPADVIPAELDLDLDLPPAANPPPVDERLLGLVGHPPSGGGGDGPSPTVLPSFRA